MKFVAISDTHGMHHQLKVPDADVVIHAGDFCMYGNEDEALEFMAWFSALPHRYKIFIAGNHDFYFERTPQYELLSKIPANIIYLNDSGVTIEGINIWGSPVQPWFFNWAFNRQRGADIKKHWDLIPTGTDVLITHGPAVNILDRTYDGQHVGCADLAEAINRIKPRVFVCGHIHEAYGELHTNETYYINASNLNRKYKMVFKPIEFTL